MYVEASWPRTEGETAVLQSEWLSTTNPACELSFFYHSYGDNVGKLEVQVLGTSFNRFADKILDGHSTDDWISGSVDIGVVSTARIIFTGSIGSAYDGDIAIDDVAFHSCGGKLSSLYFELTVINNLRTLV